MSKANHYPSLELCKKLTEADFPRTEKFYMKSKSINHILFTYESHFSFKRWDYWAPSVMELLDELPKYVKGIPLQIDYGTGQGIYCTHCYVKYSGINYTWLDLPNALAEMWLWLKENNLLPKK